jgi:hypothetical protein
MWVMKLKTNPSQQFLGSLAIKHQVSMTGYPLSYYKDDKWLYLIAAGMFFGDEKNIRSLMKDMKTKQEVVNFEINGDFAIVTIKQPLFSEPFYNPQLIRPGPVTINKDGNHIWNLASFDRKVLEEVLEFSEKHIGAKLIKFKQEKVSNISFTKLLPDLTKHQKMAMGLAIKHGYYDYPKKINMEKLAGMMKISYSTFQAHLKKAEGKLLPEIYKEL